VELESKPDGRGKEGRRETDEGSLSLVAGLEEDSN
jgi:hypothetical protein